MCRDGGCSGLPREAWRIRRAWPSTSSRIVCAMRTLSGTSSCSRAPRATTWRFSTTRRDRSGGAAVREVMDMTRVGIRAQRATFVRLAATAALVFITQVGVPQLGVAQFSAARQHAPIVYTLRAPQPATHVLQVEATVPTERRDSVDLMMAIWSPGYYRVEHYETRVRGFAARTADGTALRFTQPAPNRWRIFTAGRPS